MYDLVSAAVLLLDCNNLRGVADSASWQIFLQGLQQHVTPDAADFMVSSVSIQL